MFDKSYYSCLIFIMRFLISTILVAMASSATLPSSEKCLTDSHKFHQKSGHCHESTSMKCHDAFESASCECQEDAQNFTDLTVFAVVFYKNYAKSPICTFLFPKFVARVEIRLIPAHSPFFLTNLTLLI